MPTPVSKFAGSDFDSRQIGCQRTFFESFASSLSRILGCLSAMQQSRNFRCKNFLGFVDFRTTQRPEPFNFIKW